LVVLVSDDNNNYYEAAARDECNDKTTEIELPAMPTARYVQMLIEEGKQGNNIQINEVEFRDDEGTRIVSYVQLASATLARPAELTLLYDDFDLTDAGVKREENLAIFSWNEGMQEWTMIGGEVDLVNNWLTVNLNHLSTFAIFEASSPLGEVRWSYNPFSPNGDGIADTTTIVINFHEESGEQARVEIFDYTGKLIRTLVHEETQTGHISIVWDGRDENDEMVSIGPYIYQVRIGKEIRNGVLVVAR
jgi:gliding motility-associated-like protein